MKQLLVLMIFQKNFLKLLDERALEILTKLCVDIYRTGIWPEDFTKSVMIPIPKMQKQWTVLTTE